jgi:hypothetical protein
MSSRVIGMAFTNKAVGDKSYNNAIGGIGARTIPVRSSILTRTWDNKKPINQCVCLNKFQPKPN